MSEVCLHRDAVDFREESAIVRIGKCPDCGKDTEFEYAAAVSPEVQRLLAVRDAVLMGMFTTAIALAEGRDEDVARLNKDYR